jgi:diketogulonate reductase-like aldo/keto reductase
MSATKTLQSKAKLLERFYPGVEIPWLGLGVWQTAKGGATYDAVRAAIDAGYRHIDTAKIYGNEADVGRAVRDSGVPRGEIFVTTKLWNADHGYDQAKRACDKSLAALELDYVDLYLIHWPEPRRIESWRALVELREAGKCRAIGVSNFTIVHLEQLLMESDVVPAINQVELHPFLYQRELIAYCASKGIHVEAYSPLAHGERLAHHEVARIAKKLAVRPAQILIRWALEHDLIVIPKSSKKARIIENSQVFDFAIAPDDVRALDALDEGLRTCWDPSSVP